MGTWEAGFAAGIANYRGDVSQKVSLKETKPAVTIFGRRNFSSVASWKFQFTVAQISGNDQNSKEYKYRNLAFQSMIYEIGNRFEYNFDPFGVNIHNNNKSLYIASGINIFRFNPIRKIGDAKHELRQLKTEGQKKGYSLLQISVPLVLGYKINLNRRTVGFIEMCWNKTFTDYLDDVSKTYPDFKQQTDNNGLFSAQLSHAQTLNGNSAARVGSMRGDTHLKDWYFFIQAGVSFRFFSQICPLF